jgi:hypothetical protein
VECTVESNAGVGSENIYGAEFIFHPRNTRSTVFTVRDVPLEGKHASLLLERFALPACHEHSWPPRDIRHFLAYGNGCTNPARTACNQRRSDELVCIVQNHIVLLVDLVQRTAVGLMVPLRTPATSSRFKILPLAVMGKLDNGNRYSGMLYLDNA